MSFHVTSVCNIRKDGGWPTLTLWERHSITAVCAGRTKCCNLLAGSQPREVVFMSASMGVNNCLRAKTSVPIEKVPEISTASTETELVRNESSDSW